MVYPKPKVPGEETLLDIMTARTKFFDVIIDLHKANCDQFVVLGAGLDTRCYNDFSDVQIMKFEADLAHNSKFKRQMLKKAGIDNIAALGAGAKDAGADKVKAVKDAAKDVAKDAAKDVAK